MTITSSTGGRIIKTTGGLIHYGNTDRLLNVANDEPARTGRPTKESVENGVKFDFSAFLTPVKLTGTPGRIVKFK